MRDTCEYQIPVVDLATYTAGFVTVGTPEWKALCEWVELHGLDPARILASDGVTRDAERYCIRYTGFICDDDGRRLLDRSAPIDEPRLQQQPMIEQGEAPPFPFPDLVVARLHPMPAVAP